VPLISNPLHVLEQDFLASPIVQLGGSTVGVTGDPLGGFKSAVIFQKIRDTGRRFPCTTSWKSSSTNTLKQPA